MSKDVNIYSEYICNNMMERGYYICIDVLDVLPSGARALSSDHGANYCVLPISRKSKKAENAVTDMLLRYMDQIKEAFMQNNNVRSDAMRTIIKNMYNELKN